MWWIHTSKFIINKKYYIKYLYISIDLLLQNLKFVSGLWEVFQFNGVISMYSSYTFLLSNVR